MLTGEGDIHSALIFPKNKSGSRYLRYCSLCFEKDRNRVKGISKQTDTERRELYDYLIKAQDERCCSCI